MNFLPRFLILIALITLPLSAVGQKIDLKKATWAPAVSPLPKGPFPAMNGVKVSYDLTWKGKIKAGSATVVMVPNKANPKVIQGSASGRSRGVAGKLFPYQFTYKSVIDYDQILSSRTVTMKDSTRKNQNDTTIHFLDQKVVCERKITERKTGTSRDIKRTFLENEKLGQGIFSVILSSRTLALTQNQEITSLVVPVDRPYLIRTKVLGRENRKVKGKVYKTIKLDVKILGRVNNDTTLKPYDKVKGCTLWLSDDADRLPLELRADIFIGHVSAFMTKKEYIK